MADPERARIHLQSIATWTELDNTVNSVIPATLRNDAAAVEAARAKAHDLLDHHLDLKIQAVAAMRRDIEKQFREG